MSQAFIANDPPLKSRIVRSSAISCTIQNPLMPSRPKRWDDTQLQKACQDVYKGQAVRRVALNYGIPKSTLHDRISGKVTPGAKSGPPAYLSAEEEDELVPFLNGCSSIGYARSKKTDNSISSKSC